MVQDELYTQEWLEFYDRLFPEENYKATFDILHGIIQRYNPKAKDVLEIACGTGRYAKYFAGKGYRIRGTDLSADALAIARKRVKKAEFHVEEMEELNENERYDVVCCLFEPFRYNPSYHICVDVLKRARRALKQGGLFICDFSIYPKAGQSDKPAIHNEVKLSRGRTAIRDEFIYTSGSFDLRKDVIKVYKKRLFKEPLLIVNKEVKRAPLIKITERHMMTMLHMAGLRPVEAFAGFQRDADGSPSEHSWIFVAVKQS